MTEQTAVATRLIRARDLTAGQIIVQRKYDFVNGGSHEEQQVVIDVETHRNGFTGDLIVSGIAVDPTGEQVELCTGDWTLYRVVVEP